MTEASQQSVRVETSPVEEKDFSALLTENLDLLRRSEAHANQLLTAIAGRENAERALQEEKEKARIPGGYRGIRRKIIWLNVLVSLMVMFGPTAVWYHLQPILPPQVCAIGLGGIVWMLVTCVWLDGLADRENR